MNKLVTILTCAAMVVSLAGCGSSTSTKTSAEDQKKVEKTITDTLDVKSGTSDSEKVETVYVMSDSTGKVKETTANCWLKNIERTEELKDATDLKSVKNIKGDETYSKASGNNITWKANGADIYYEGKTDKKAPVEVKVSYYLDGKKTEPKDMAGKSGKVKIRFEYTNTYKTDGIFTPFIAVSGLILPSEKFTNIKVDNGKNISDGKNNIIVGYAMPGLKEDVNLSIGDKKINPDVPESFEITADAKDFELSMTMTMVTSSFFDKIDTEDLDLDDLFDKLDSKLDTFKDGTEELKDGIKDYTDAVNTIAKAQKKLKNGTSKLKKASGELSTKLSSGFKELGTSIGKAQKGAAQLQAGYEGNSGAVAGSKALSDNLTKLNKAVQGLQLPTASADSNLSDAEKLQIATQIKKEITAALPADLKAYLTAAKTNDPLIMAAYQAAYQTAYASAYQSGMKAGANTAVTKINTTVSGMSSQITELKTGVSQLNAGSTKLYEGLEKLYEGTKTLQKGLSDGVKTITKSTKQINAGTAKLKTGVSTLDNGMGALNKGTNKLNGKSGDLNDGANKLVDGTTKLTDKLGDLEDDVNVLTNRAKDIVNLGKAYQSFTGKNTASKGEVKFIIKTDSIDNE